MIKRFEQRDHAVDSKGVAEYLRALVVTNAIAEYLPDEQTGKPSSLPTLVRRPCFVAFLLYAFDSIFLIILKLSNLV